MVSITVTNTPPTPPVFSNGTVGESEVALLHITVAIERKQ